MAKTNPALRATFFFWALVLLMGAVPLLSGALIREGLHPGPYPAAVDQPLLAEDYNVVTSPGVSPYNAQTTSKNYPVFPARSCGTNNLRYWRRPGNGTCTPSEFCGSLYEATEQPIPPKAEAPLWDDGIRVNYYESSR